VTLINYIAVLACVCGIATGQILFKLTASSLAGLDQPWKIIFSPTLITALAIYGIATIAWIWQLREIPLSQAYPFMALSFVLVPLASLLFLGETVSLRYWIGTACIVGGIILTVR